MPAISHIVNQFLPEIIEFRRDLHQYPELGYEEVETSQKVARRLGASGSFQVETGIASTGVVATLGVDKPGKGIALRADMDCLPITETSGKSWASKNPGFMHACGHDGHTSCLLGTALVLAEFTDKLQGPVKFIFQPAEEGGAGGKKMVEAGVLTNPSVELLFGLHGWPNLEVGKVTSCEGPMMANADEFEIKIHGRGGHAAYPHQCINPIVVASRLVEALQPLTTPDPVAENSSVVTVSKIAGGTAFNIIPDTVTLLGTIRTLNQEIQTQVFERIDTLSEEVAQSLGASVKVNLIRGYPVLVNHPDAFAYLNKTLNDMEHPVMLESEVFPQMVGEDFAYFAQEVPACFFGLGLKPKGADHYPQLHQANFDFNDDALPIGIRCFSELVLNFWD